jgi:NADH-quinone oxidoreductase subunit E
VNELINKYPEEIERLLAKYPANFRKSAVMPLLYMAQRKLGYLTKVQLAEVAEITGMSITDVDSIAGFYSLFHENTGSASRPVEGSASRPVEGGRYRVQVCTDLPCALRGAEEFLSQLCQNIGIKVGETTPDGAVTVEEVTCLAGCHRAPMFQLQGDGDIVYYENQTVEKAAGLVAELRARGVPSTGQRSAEEVKP